MPILKEAMPENKTDQSKAFEEIKNDFLARMSHEMRTPLNAIIGMCTIAQSSSDSGQIKSCLEKINDASLHLLGMINEMLDFAKISNGEFSLINTKFSLSKMLQQNGETIKFVMDAKDQILSLEFDPGLPETIIADKQMLSLVIYSILSNAAKFTNPGGSIKFEAKKLGHSGKNCRIGISVQDTGIGISKEAKGKIFNIFEQADGSLVRKHGGAGLGLPLSMKIVQMMGGEIHLESEPGKGSRFSFEIDVETAEAEDESLNAEKKAEPPFTGLSVLLAEDVEINREIIIALLEDSGISIDCAENGLEAFNMFKASPDKYGAIIMDIHMPEMDGYESTRQIRAFEKNSSGADSRNKIPIIAMTANVFQTDIKKCLEAGMTSHLGKPINFAELMAELRSRLL